MRVNNDRVYVKDGSSTVVYGDEIGLLYNGCYIAKQGATWYLFDSDGDRVGGVYGDDVSLVNGRWKCVNGNSVRYVDS